MTEHKDLKHISWNRVFDLIGSPNKEKCWQLYFENHAVIDKARGSKSKHQAWEGGYIDHICETVGIAEDLFETLSKRRPLEFTLADAALVLFLHDLEKPWKHANDVVGGEVVSSKIVDNAMFGRASTNSPKLHPKIMHCLNMAKKYGIELTPIQENAVLYVEGEGDDWTPYQRVQGPLAAFCHICDVTSARIWFNYPRGS